MSSLPATLCPAELSRLLSQPANSYVRHPPNGASTPSAPLIDSQRSRRNPRPGSEDSAHAPAPESWRACLDSLVPASRIRVGKAARRVRGDSTASSVAPSEGGSIRRSSFSSCASAVSSSGGSGLPPVLRTSPSRTAGLPCGVRDPLATPSRLAGVASVHAAVPQTSSPPPRERPAAAVAIPRTVRAARPGPSWDQTAFSLSLSFTGPLNGPNPPSDASAPPAFFPLQRVGFSPRLQVKAAAGIPMSLFGGMTLGVTGTVSVPVVDKRTGRQADDANGKPRWKCQRVVADFVTDLSQGLDIWKSDAAAATAVTVASGRRRGYDAAATGTAEGRLPPGTYMLPLSMRIPCSEKLPPSFCSVYFRISYTMSLAIWSAEKDLVHGNPLHTKVFSAPFEVLPSTLPSGPPELPRLIFEGRRDRAGLVGGVWEGLKRVVSLGSGYAGPILAPGTEIGTGAGTGLGAGSGGGECAGVEPASEPTIPARDHLSLSMSRRRHHRAPSSPAALTIPPAPSHPSWTHVVTPYLPSSSFSPSSHAVIPVTLSIIDKPGVPTDLYVRISLVRSVYVRERSHDLWTEAADALLPEDMMMEYYLKEEKELVSRWGYFPYAARPHAHPNRECEVLIRDIGLPLFSPCGPGFASSSTSTSTAGGWAHGYSSSLTLEPSPAPNLFDGTASWFSPALRERPPVAKEYARHLHASCRFAVVVEVGFAKAALLDEAGRSPLERALGGVKDAVSSAFEIPDAHTFTKPQAPGWDRGSGLSLTNPFPPAPEGWNFFGSSRATAPTGAQGSGPAFASGPGSSATASTSGAGSQAPALQPPAFPGKIRTLRCPVILGSVAEPALECLAPAPPLPSPPHPHHSAAYVAPPGLERPRAADSAPPAAATGPGLAEDGGTRLLDRRSAEDDAGIGDREAWLYAPPDYQAALRCVPAYV